MVSLAGLSDFLEKLFVARAAHRKFLPLRRQHGIDIDFCNGMLDELRVVLGESVARALCLLFKSLARLFRESQLQVHLNSSGYGHSGLLAAF